MIFILYVFNWFVNEANLLIKLLTLPVLCKLMYNLLYKLYDYINEIREKRDLFPYFTTSVIRGSKRNFIKTKCQNIDPSNDINYKSSHAFSTKEYLLLFFLKRVFRKKENENRFYLILGDSGMGKSTFMLNLFSKFNSFINIRLDQKIIKLLPLGENFMVIKEEIEKVKSPKRTILLLDGFDEIPLTESQKIKDKFDEIINLVKDFSTVIITCRTHFFSSEKDEPFELKVKKYDTTGNGFHVVKKLYVSPFDEQDISKYINKTFRFFEFNKKRRAFNIIEGTNDLMVRPMLLSYIKDIVNAGNQNLKSGFDIYEVLIVNWLQRESNKYEQDKREYFKNNLVFFTYEVTKYIYENYEKNGVYIPLEIAQDISENFKISLNEIEIKSRSLLNRNSLGNYKFSHKSIYEFFLAHLAYNSRVLDNDVYTLEYNIENHDQSKKFIEDIVFSNRVKFALPLPGDNFVKYNVELYGQFIKAKNNLNSFSIHWISGYKYQILRNK